MLALLDIELAEEWIRGIALTNLLQQRLGISIER